MRIYFNLSTKPYLNEDSLVEIEEKYSFMVDSDLDERERLMYFLLM